MSIKTELKIIADHLRSSCFLIADGILPSNEGRGYVLRRIMRRSMRQIHKLGAKEPLMFKLVDILIKEMGTSYPELTRARDVIIETLKTEEEKFRETLEKGLKILDDEILHNKNAKFSGALAFKLYDTYGFPLDLTQDICKEKKLEVDIEEFEKEMELQRDRARKNWVGSGEISEDKLFFELKEKFGETEFLYHQTTKNKAKILGIYQNFQAVNEISSNQKNAQDSIFIILDKTPFYATSGGQKGDDGNFVLAREITENSIIDYQKINNCIDIFETKKFAGNLFAHFVGDFKGNFKVGDEILALVNNRHRQLRAQNHSATHLLHKALKQVLGNSISQKGSNVDVKQLTFDFNLNRAVSELEIEQVEELVNFYIRQNSAVDTKEMELEEARESGAEALFGEKYDSKVRVVKMGPSVELCGGTHVINTGNIGVFKIISENGVASGVRRITAKSGFYALQHLKLQEQKLVALLNSLKVKQQFDEVKIDENEFLSSKVGFNDNSFFIDENSASIINDSQRKSILEALDKTSKIGEDWQQNLKDKDREIEKLKKQIWRNNLQNLTSENVGEIKIANYLFDETDAKDLREITNEVKSWNNFSQSQILAFFAKKDQKISLCLSLSSDLQNRFDASKLITPMIAKLDGKGGGGKKDFAMGGGVKIDGVNEAIAVLKDSLK
jgi:alanyl-tRNA synthetase